MIRRPAPRALLALLALLATAACGGSPSTEPDPTVLGTVTGVTVAPCPPGAPAGATCSAVTVACPGLDDLPATVAVTEPASAPLGTVFLHSNLGGTMVLDDGFAAAYGAAGMRVVQVAWQADWQTGEVGLKHAACRYATLLAWVFTDVHGGDRTRGFCAQAFGAGSGGLTFSLAHYGAAGFVDAVNVSAGPPFARIDLGCDPAAPPRAACPAIPAAPVAYSSGVLTLISGWEAAPTCGMDDRPASEILRWQNDSVLSSGAVLDFPETSLAAWYCANAPDATVGQGSLFFDAVTSDATVHCVTGGAAGGTCDGEEPWPSALPDMVEDLASRCVPRHP